MAKDKAESTATEETTALATFNPADMIVSTRPDGKDEGALGTEGIGADNLLIPRIGLAQKMSPEIEKSDPRYIEGLEFADLFHSTEKRKLGKGPLRFVILKVYDPRWKQFKPIDEGGGIIDPNVPAGDQRTKFGPSGEKPEATKFLDFLVLLLDGFDPTDPIKNVVALSLKSSALKAAGHLNFLIGARGQKLICKGVYELTTGSDKDKKSGGVYAIYKFKNAGWLKPGSPLEAMAVEMFEAWQTREAAIDEEQAYMPDVDDSMAANPEDHRPAF